MFVLGGFLPLRRFGVSFDLADDGQAVDDMTAPAQGDYAQILDILFFHPVLLCGGVFCRIHARSPSVAGSLWGQYPPVFGEVCGEYAQKNFVNFLFFYK